VRWADLEQRQPRLGDVARARLLEPGVVLVATIRRDGSPRLSPVEPWVMDGELWLSMLWGSWKARDLQRDSRILVHSVVNTRDGGDGELKLRGRAEPTDEPGVLARYAQEVHEALGWTPVPGRFHLFRVDIESVAFLRYDDATGDQFTASWPPPVEHVRRGTTATSLGDPEPLTDLLVREDTASAPLAMNLTNPTPGTSS
jgi:pyridoxamine 5'-phosphate oxidase-like protein